MDRIFELEQKRAALVDDMQVIIEKDTDEAPLTAEDELEFKTHEAGVLKLNERIARLKSMIAHQEVVDVHDVDDKSYLSQSGKSRMGIDIKKDRKYEAKGSRAMRFVIGAGIAKSEGNRESGVRYVADRLDDAEVSKALGATVTTGAGGALIPQDYRAELIDLLYAETVYRQCNPQIIPMPRGNLTMPRLSAGATASWVGENVDIPISQPAFDQIVLNAKKLVGMVPVSNDLIRRDAIAVETIVRNNLIKQLARAEDIALLTGVANSSSVPAGLTGLALPANIFNAYTTPTLSIVNNTLSTMELNLKGNNVPTNSAKWIVHPVVRAYLNTLTDSTGRYFFRDDLNRGMLFGYPMRETTQLSSNVVVNGTAVVTTLTAASTSSTSMAVTSGTGILVGMAVTATGITGTVLVTVVSGTTITLGTAVSVLSGATVTFTPFTLTGTPLILAAFDQVILGDTMEMFADSSSEATYVSGGSAISAFSRDQTVFRIIEEIDSNVMHPAAITVANLAGWAPTGYTGVVGAAYITQTATYPASPALSATPV